jgi:hypothetical protein
MQQRFPVGEAARRGAGPEPALATRPPEPDPAQPPVFTVGHSTRSLPEFLEILQRANIRCLVDVRTVPRSRRVPQFNRETLPGFLEASDIRYVHEPRLGGLRHSRNPNSPNAAWQNPSFRSYADYLATPEFRDGLAAVLELRSHGPVAIMCAEAVPWRCHRSLIADVLRQRRIPVFDITGPGPARLHEWPPFARGTSDGNVIYPASPRPSRAPARAPRVPRFHR